MVNPIQRQTEAFGIFTANDPGPMPEDLQERQQIDDLKEHQQIEYLLERQQIEDLLEHQNVRSGAKMNEIQRQAAQFGIFEAAGYVEPPPIAEGYQPEIDQIIEDRIRDTGGSMADSPRVRRETDMRNGRPPGEWSTPQHQGALRDLLSGPKIQPGLLNW